MKKIIFLFVLGLLIGKGAIAQELGIRGGNVTAGNVAIDALFNVGKFSKVHGDVSFGSGVGIDLLWDFLYKPLGNEALNFYVGAGPYTALDDPFYLGAAAEAGLDYRFKGAPLVIGVDYRPRLSIIESTDFYWSGFGVNLRYVFGKKK